MKKVLAVCLAILAVIALVACFFIYQFFSTPERIAKSFSELIERGFSVKYDTRVVMETPPKPVSEYIVLEQEVPAQITYTNTWAGSTKTIKTKAVMRAKYGYRLSGLKQLASIDFNSRTDTVIASLPDPEIISIEPVKNSLEYEAENGIWNKPGPEDYAAATNALISETRSGLEKNGKFRTETDNAMRAEIEGLLKRSPDIRDYKVEVHRLP